MEGKGFVGQPWTPREVKDASGYAPPRKGRVAAVIFLGVGKTGTSALQQPLRHVGRQADPSLEHADQATQRPRCMRFRWLAAPLTLPLAGDRLEALSAASKPVSPMVVTFLISRCA